MRIVLQCNASVFETEIFLSMRSAPVTPDKATQADVCSSLYSVRVGRGAERAQPLRSRQARRDRLAHHPKRESLIARILGSVGSRRRRAVPCRAQNAVRDDTHLNQQSSRLSLDIPAQSKPYGMVPAEEAH
jgi:hypothetical protein